MCNQYKVKNYTHYSNLSVLFLVRYRHRDVTQSAQILAGLDVILKSATTLGKKVKLSSVHI